MSTTPWADDILGKDIAYNGAVQSPRRKILNFVPGSGISLTIADNTGTGSTDVTIVANGSLTGGVDYKDAVRAATTGNITLSGLQTIDGVVLVANDRVLVWQQTTPAQNGIYVASSGAWQRATDANLTQLVTSGLIVPVSEGTLYTKATFKLTTINPITLGVTGLTFERQPRTIDDVLSLGNVVTTNPLLFADSQFLQLGQTSPALSGTIRLRNANSIYWRNSGNTAEFGIEVTVGNDILLGGGTAAPTNIRLEASTVKHTSGGTALWASSQVFPNQPGILLDPACGNGTGTNCFFGVNSPTTARAGMNLWLFGGTGGTGNQNGGNTNIYAGLASGTGVRGSVNFYDDISSQTLLGYFRSDGVFPRLGLNVPNIRFDATMGSDSRIWTEDQTAPSTNGKTLTVQAQNATGSGSTGGALRLQSGTGVSASGDMQFYVGAFQFGAFSTAGFSLYSASLFYQSFVTSPKIYQLDQTAASTAGQKLTIQAQNATGTTSAGGALDIGPGSGTTAGGLGRLMSGSAAARFQWNDTGIGFYTTAPIAKPSYGVANATLQNQIDGLFTALGTLGLVTDNRTNFVDSPFTTESNPTTTGNVTSNSAECVGTLGAGITRTLPASPATGDWYQVNAGPSAATSNVTIGRNGKTIDGAAADKVLNTAYAKAFLVYNGTEWRTLI